MGSTKINYRPERADGLVGHTVDARKERRIHDSFSFGVLPLEDEPAHFVEVFEGLGRMVVVGRTSPESLLVELELLIGGIAVDHHADVGIAEREGLDPFGGRSVIPEFERISFNGRDGESREREKRQTAKKFH